MKIRIKYKAIAPISHIGETSSTGSYFQTVKTSDGNLPIITANSVRGILRDNAAKYLLSHLGIKVSKEIFNILFSGGNINGTMKNDVGKAKAIREHFPMISLFGGGLGDMIMSGKMAVCNLYPLTVETYENLGEEFTETSWKNLIGEMDFTRSDDGKDDILASYMTNPEEEKQAKASTQMRYTVQYMAKDSEFIQDIYLFDTVTDVEKGALISAFAEWFKLPKLGGMANKGFGFFDADTDFGVSVHGGNVELDESAKDYINQYDAFIDDEKSMYIEMLGSGKNAKV